jgi:hypothetical protein
MNGDRPGSKYLARFSNKAHTVVPRCSGFSSSRQCREAPWPPGSLDAEMLFVPLVELFGIVRLKKDAAESGNAFHV